MVDVVTGNSMLGNSNMDRTHLPAGIHSTVNNVADPTIFVVYHDAAAYPKYEIMYKLA